MEEKSELIKCPWSKSHRLLEEYHDEEWGVLPSDDNGQFEHLILETFQAGLSWLTILKKREAFREVFHRFDPHKVGKMTEIDILRLMQDARIIRSRPKIEAAVNNARLFNELVKEYGSFTKFIVQFRPITRSVYLSMSDIPSKTPESEAFSAELKRRGFKFIGPVSGYAHMESVGIVNDHEKSCFRYQPVEDMILKAYRVS